MGTIAIKAAPFNRYHTLDVARGVVEARAEDRVAIYTGNDDHIVLDLLSPFAIRRGQDEVRVRARGGLLGHWSVWTKRAVELLAQIHAAIDDHPLGQQQIRQIDVGTDRKRSRLDLEETGPLVLFLLALKARADV